MSTAGSVSALQELRGEATDPAAADDDDVVVESGGGEVDRLERLPA